jgi:hypothetical protein
MRTLIIILLLSSVNCFSQQKITLSVGKPQDLIGKILNSTPPTGWTATYQTGFNEFSIKQVEDGTGDYELFFDDRYNTKYIRFHDPSEIQGKIGTVNEKTIGSGWHYPKIMMVGSVYYLYFFNFGDSKTYLVTGSSIAELQAATPVDIGLPTDIADFRAMPLNGGGGYIGVGQHSQAKIFTAPTPLGPWTDQGFVFAPDASNPNQLLNPMYAVNQADPQMFYLGSEIYLMFNGISFNHQNSPPISHQCVVKIDPSTYRAIGRPTEFIHCYDRSFHYVVNNVIGPYQAIGNPRYVPIQGREEIWYMGGTKGAYDAPDTGSIAHYVISPSGFASNLLSTSPKAVVKVVPGERTDLAHNVTHTYYGTVSNTTSGITVNTNNSGLWNFVSVGNLYNFSLNCSFTLSSLPASGTSTVFHLIPEMKGIDLTQKVELLLSVNSAGDLTLTFTDYGGTSTNYSAGTVSVGVRKDFTLSQVPSGAGYNFTISGGAPNYSLNGLGQTGIYSLFNDGTDLISPANQMYGTIHSFEINLL